MIQVGIVGATGYTGLELLRLLSNHSEVEVVYATSRSEAGRKVADFFPGLRGICDLAYSEPKASELAKCDIVFYATPHAVAMHSMKELLDHGAKVIDLSADFRLQDIPLWEKWYGCEHVFKEGIEQAVYGLPEMNREQIQSAQLVAAPGCYPTSIQLGFLPLLEAGLIDTSDLIANSASGVSGAGRKGDISLSFPECNENFKAYGVGGHRHLPETEQGLRAMTQGNQEVNLTFVPHLLPTTRGIVSTLYANLTVNKTLDELVNLYVERFADEPFVDVLPKGQLPALQNVRGTNFCRIGLEKPLDRNKVVIVSAIDNLVKGASGQAIQIMNIMTGFEEMQGLRLPSIAP
ncbi:MAG: N-acetyl-gamma-glutamyl-phosphate reductase [Cellvibrionales bacterium]|nr:N-acetyl-gamma-glutamyl-phosphate reductase [Cellvibrionales bacterium]